LIAESPDALLRRKESPCITPWVIAAGVGCLATRIVGEKGVNYPQETSTYNVVTELDLKQGPNISNQLPPTPYLRKTGEMKEGHLELGGEDCTFQIWVKTLREKHR